MGRIDSSLKKITMQPQNELTQSADKVAIGLSFVCALHCLLPLALALVPSAAIFGLDDELFHRVLLLGVLPVSAFALLSGQRRHKDKTVLAIGVTGLIILIVAAAIGHELFGETGERLITVSGSILVAISHLRNFQLCQLRPPQLDSD